jgi:hypothetical protein
MMTFVSKRTLPGIRVDLFAAFLDGQRHGSEIGRIDGTSEAHEVLARSSCGFGQAAREIQDPALVRSVQAVHLFDNFVFDGLCHNEINLGKGILKVKGARATRKWPTFCKKNAKGRPPPEKRKIKISLMG